MKQQIETILYYSPFGKKIIYRIDGNNIFLKKNECSINSIFYGIITHIL